MIAKFFCYEKDTGQVIYFNEAPPINEYLEENKTVHQGGGSGLGGINWDNVGVWENDIGVEVDEEYYYTYNPTANELTKGEINDDFLT